MYKKQLTKAEFELANNALESILDEPVEDIDLTDTLPPKTDLTDSNKVFKGKLSILFVDMRKSTDLTDELKSKRWSRFIAHHPSYTLFCGYTR